VAVLLQRLAMLVFRRRRVFLAGWLLIMFVVIGGYVVVGSSINSEFTIPGSSSQNALNELQKSLPRAAGTSAQIVFESPAGTRITEARYQTAVEASVSQAKTAPRSRRLSTRSRPRRSPRMGGPRWPRSNTPSPAQTWIPAVCRRWSTRPDRPNRPV